MTREEQRPITLALDSGGLACSAVVALGDCILSAQRVEGWHGQAEVLLPIINAAMLEAGLSPGSVELVATSVGPGSFTGIRVGLAAARGIVLATSARLVGVSSFEAAVAGHAPPDCDDIRLVVVALESRRQDLYVQIFDRHNNAVGLPVAVMPAGFGEMVDNAIGAAPLLIVGDAAPRAAALLAHRENVHTLEDSAPDAVGVLRASLRRWHSQKFDAPRPLYLRLPDVTAARRPWSSSRSKI
jgi:tRNA threonylcarbamoyladenosine biosynthesis protein TsaB